MKQYEEWRKILNLKYSERDETIFSAGYTFALIETSEDNPPKYETPEQIISTLKQLFDTLSNYLGDTDPAIEEDWTDEEIQSEYPIFWVAQNLMKLIKSDYKPNKPVCPEITDCKTCEGWYDSCSPDFYPDYIDNPEKCEYYLKKTKCEGDLICPQGKIIQTCPLSNNTKCTGTKGDK